ncbi:MAG TPA: FkbM family methyltransferase [Candidatus Sulfotelmatobacter sp.]|nr:FkbM family methyltransferase [Candidatus Sulfotelmatobacter sp.]
MQTESRLEQIGDLIKFGSVSFNFEDLLETHYRRWVRSGDTIIDIGAHTGRHLEPLLECVGLEGKAIAFEPLPFAFDVLRERFKGTQVELNNMALGKEAGMVEFTYARGTPEESGLRRRTYNAPELADPTLIEVRIDTLDRYCADLESIAFIKIDVEGAEIDCLKGAVKTLQRHRPVVSVEYGRPSYSVYGHTKDTLYELAVSYGYVMFDIFINRLDTIEDWRSTCDRVSWDYFMVPRERCTEFLERMQLPVHQKPNTISADRSEEERLAKLVQSLRAELDALHNHHAVAMAENNAILHSHSWRVTAPLRAIARAMRK